MKKKLLIKALGYVLSAAMLFGSVPVPVMAAETSIQDEVSVIDVTDAEEGDDDTEETVSDNSSEEPASGENEYPLAGKLELLDLDWKNASDETLNHYLGMTDWNKIGMWLDAFPEEELNEILARDTVLVQPTYVTEADGDQVEMKYYEYALKVYGEEKGYLYAAPSKSSGYWTTKIVKLNAAGVAVNTATITHKVSGIDTSVATTERQSITVAKSVASNWCNISTSDDNQQMYKTEDANAYTMARSNFTFTKPAGYTITTSYDLTSSTYGLFWHHGKTFGSGSMFDGGIVLADKHYYPNNVTCQNVSTADLIAGNYTGTHNVLSLVNIWVNAGIGTTSVDPKGNLTQTITLAPISYNVNYNGNGATSGSVAAQNCTYDQTYTTQGNGYSKEYTVTYDGNGGSPAVASQKASYTFKAWNTVANGSGTSYAAAASYKNLTAVKNGAVTLYAQWNPATVKLPTAERTGYQFGGWTISNKSYAGLANYTPTANVTAKANWTANTYKIVLNDGSDKETITASYDQSVTLPTPTRAGYTFTGWVGESGAYKGDVKNLTAVNNATVNLTASWEAHTNTPYTVYYWKVQEDGTAVAFGTDEEDILPAFEIFYGTTDTVVTVPAPDAGYNAAGVKYITPASKTVQIKGDGTEVVHFYYDLDDEDPVHYFVEHYIKTSPDGEYKKLTAADEMKKAEEGTVVTPPLSQKAIAAVNAVSGCYCKEPALQTVTVKENMVIKYYYDCVKKGSTGSISDDDINEIVKKLAAGLSFSMEIDGATYEIVQNPDGTFGIKFMSTNETKVVIPDVIQIGDKVYRVTEIYEKAFKDNTTIKEVVLSANISKIGNSAFEGCTSLEKITLRDGLVTIGNKAFSGCTSLKSIKLPATVQKIGDYAFQNCTSLKTVTLNNGLVTIGKKAFYNCTALIKIKIPYTVIKIGAYAFQNCKKLKTLKFGEESRLLSIGYGGFKNCVSLTSVKLPDKLTKITKQTFYGCKKLKSVKIGASVTSIGIGSFKNCTSLKTITGGTKVNMIYQYAFQNCKAMIKYTVTSRVQTIGEKAFYNCKKLKTVTIKSKALTSVGKDAFKKCKKNITFKVPDSKISAYSKILKGKY